MHIYKQGTESNNAPSSLALAATPRSISQWLWNNLHSQALSPRSTLSPLPPSTSSVPLLTPSTRRHFSGKAENNPEMLSSEPDHSLDGSESSYPTTPRTDPRRLLRDHYPFSRKTFPIMSSSTALVAVSSVSASVSVPASVSGSVSASGSTSVSGMQELPENQVIDDFLKNNGGYLDDSDSSGDEEDEHHTPRRMLAVKTNRSSQSQRSISNVICPAKKLIKTRHPPSRQLFIHQTSVAAPSSRDGTSICSSDGYRKLPFQPLGNLNKQRQPFRNLVLGEDDLLRVKYGSPSISAHYA